MHVRRVVAGVGLDSKATVLSDAPAPRAVNYRSVPGFASALLWATPAGPMVGVDTAANDTSIDAKFIPGPGETRLIVVTFPPDSVMMRADFDAAAFGAEFAQNAPGLAECFEPDHPGMHATDSIDYDVVLEGEITLELDDGVEILLTRHDVVVQHGNRHAWRNKGQEAAKMLFVLIGANRR